MLFLAGSIILTAYLILAFKMVQRLGLDTFQCIVFNYITCVITGSVVQGSFALNSDAFSAGWFGWAMVMGVMFIVLFYILAITTSRINVAVASIAYKLSLVIPVVFGIYLYNEPFPVIRWLGTMAALVSIVLVSSPNEQTKKKNLAFNYLLYLLPVVLFTGSGLLDTLIKYVETTYINSVNQNVFLVCAFASAAASGILLLLGRIVFKNEKLSWQNVAAGVLIGIPNYFSIWCFIHFLKVSEWPSSAAIPLNNIGIILLSVIVAAIVFKEKLSRKNILGIAVAIIALALIAFK